MRYAHLSVLGFLLILFGCGGSKELKNAQKYIDVHEYGKAKELLELELKADPKSTEAYLLLGKVNLLLGDQRSAADAFDKAVLVDTGAKKRIAGTYFEAAKTLYEDPQARNRLDSIYGYLDKAITFNPDLGSDVASWALSSAKNATGTNKTTEPIALLNVIAKLYPDGRGKIGSFCLETARTYLQKSFYPEAATYAVCSGDLSPDNLKPAADILKTAGLMESLPDHRQEAEFALDKAVQWDQSLVNDDDVTWVKVVKLQADSTMGLRDYLAKFPAGKHAAEARASQQTTDRKYTQMPSGVYARACAMEVRSGPCLKFSEMEVEGLRAYVSAISPSLMAYCVQFSSAKPNGDNVYVGKMRTVDPNGPMVTAYWKSTADCTSEVTNVLIGPFVDEHTLWEDRKLGLGFGRFRDPTNYGMQVMPVILP